MNNILNEIAEYAAYRVFTDKREYSLEELKSRCAELDKQQSGHSDAAKQQGQTGKVPSSRLKSAIDMLTGRKRQQPAEAVPEADGAVISDQASGLASADASKRSDGLYRFGQALKKPGVSVISEIKKASPSKGIISEDFRYLDIAGEYQRAGADCISCLTEPKWFMGSDDIFAAVRAYTCLPMIRKDFVVDEYQLYQAKLLGADAVLLICALLDADTINYYLGICRELKMDALVETHDASEIESAVRAGARIIGVNNRNLKNFSVDFANARELRSMVPDDCIYVAESGVKSVEDAAVIKEIGADAVLIGEALMRADDKAALIRAFKEA